MCGSTRKHEVSAGIVVFAGERVLVIRNRFGEWVLPKGKVEPGEPIEATALREVREETGIRAEILRPAGKSEYTYCSDRTGDAVDKVVHWFVGKVEGNGGDLCPQTTPQAEEGISVAAFVPWRDAVTLLKYDGRLVEDAASQVSMNS